MLYDTSNIIRRYPTNEYVAGALDLYLDAFNIFLALLRILNAGTALNVSTAARNREGRDAQTRASRRFLSSLAAYLF